jgi:hypothetical protein
MRVLTLASGIGTSSIVRVSTSLTADVFRRACAAVWDDGEAADEQVARPRFVQGAADPDDVFDLRLACVRAIVRVIHASASSKDVKR